MKSERSSGDATTRQVLERLHRQQALVDRFVEAIRGLPQVRRVLFEEDRQGPRIITVIEAPPFDAAYRDPIYQAELDALDAYPAMCADFDLVNLREYPEAARDQILPRDGRVCFAR